MAYPIRHCGRSENAGAVTAAIPIVPRGTRVGAEVMLIKTLDDDGGMRRIGALHEIPGQVVHYQSFVVGMIKM